MDRTAHLLRRAQARGFSADQVSERLPGGFLDQEEAVSRLDSTKDVEREEAYTALAMFGDRRAVPALLRSFQRERDPWLRHLSGRALSTLRGRRAVAGLAQLVRAGDWTELREEAAYALGWTFDPDAADILTLVLGDGDEDPRVRGQAAESLSHVLRSTHPASRKRRLAVTLLLTALADPAPEVRFWAAFTLGQLRVRRAVEPLRALTEDRTGCPGWWAVGDEASDALLSILHRTPPPDRVRGTVATAHADASS